MGTTTGSTSNEAAPGEGQAWKDDAAFELFDIGLTLHASSTLDIRDPENVAVPWLAILNHVGPGGEPSEVAAATFYVLDQGELVGHTMCQGHIGDVEKYYAFYDEEVRERVGQSVADGGQGLVVVDRISVPRALRGRGLEELVFVEALVRLSKWEALVVCEPASSELKLDDPVSESDWVPGVDLSVGFGFEEWVDGLFYLDPALPAFADMRDRTRARFRAVK